MTSRPSLLDLDVRLSVHTAPEYLSLCDFDSCGHSGDNFCESQEDSSRSSCCDFHRGDVTLLFLLREISTHSVRMNDFVF